MGKPTQKSIFIDNHDHGVVHIHQNEKTQPQTHPEESLGPPKSLRWTPTELNDLQKQARSERKNFNAFVREVTRIGNHYSTSEIQQLIDDRALYRTVMRNRNVFAALINSLRK